MEGEKLELQIKVIGSKPVTVTWYRDDEKIEPDNHCKLLSDDEIHLLRVNPVEIDDEAIYKCVVKNPAGQDQCEAQILVEGTAAFLTCNIVILFLRVKLRSSRGKRVQRILLSTVTF